MKEINIKNCGSYYTDDITNIINIYKILIYERQCQNIFIYCVAYKTSEGEKAMRFSFDNVYEYIEKHAKDEYLL